jgi:2-polyprenyl-3-methyl-5-hydroxy-6-metoxy-1,4-benzoquinol methylase
MDKQTSELPEKIRQQFDTAPYPRTPLEQSPKDDANRLYIHNLVTPYYLRNNRFIDTQDKLILDAGCGSGYTSLVLAEANPGARIIGIDLSEESIKLARHRLQYHGFNNVEFHVLSIEKLPQLNLKFDYINCDDVLYLLPEPSLGLQAMKAVLKPEGIIRANLHSALQRVHYYRGQEVFKMMGLMDNTPGDLEIELVRETIKALKDDVPLKAITWHSHYEKDPERILMNYLFQGDTGYTIPEMFSALRASGLEFISMVNWRQWNLQALFKPDNLPVFLGMTLPEISTEEQLHLYELINPAHRLLDFWCGHPNSAQPFVPMAEWQQSDWLLSKVHLHPQVLTPALKGELLRCVTQLQPFQISRQLQIAERSISIGDSIMAACLLPLWEEAQPMKALLERWQKLRPVHPVTLEPTSEQEALELVQSALAQLESLGYVLVEHIP